MIIDTRQHVIDCDAAPLHIGGTEVAEDEIAEHRKSGLLKWDPSKISLWLSPNQQNYGFGIEGNELRKELTNRPVLNANVLHYLLAHPHLIPEEWKEKDVFFWGTVYRDFSGVLYVSYLCWWEGGVDIVSGRRYSGKWGWLCSNLGKIWGGTHMPAAVLIG